MKLVSIVSVKDDVEVIGPSVRNRLEAGFDEVVVIAVEPSAEMRAAAASLADAAGGRVHTVLIDALDPAGDFLSFEAEPMRSVLAATRPDWLLLTDADEFVVAAVADLHDAPELAGEGPLSLQRYNYARRTDETAETMLARLADPAGLPLIAERRIAMKNGLPVPGVRWSEHRISPRPFFRPRSTRRFDVGAHHLIGPDGTRLRAEGAAGILIAHLPFTSLSRFERKMENVRAHLTAIGGVHAATAAHWKHWLTRLEEGRLAEEFAREAFTEDEFAARAGTGAVATAAVLFERLAAADRSVR
ncbi:hypothetical protein DLJ53_32190 [Acuticoccus sediminis]|uniref:Glycosyl transferase family 2 n=1 Tax=Acuticoccus sediminis TaxID=2184697 RepID=A0A8B2NFW3_9HYPH|nr:hypothetical protein [Acuticoccus sediminis]RAH96570.1 hypothetical protein DLJ53_32190 [Acuticoccus sediminis]